MKKNILPGITGMSTRYPVIIILVILAATFINALLLNHVINSNNHDFRVLVQQKQKEYLSRKADWVRIEVDTPKSISELSRSLRNSRMFEIEKPVGVYIFSRTSDDRYFRLQDIVISNPLLSKVLKKGTTLKDSRSVDHMRRGLTEVSVDVMIRSQKQHYWQNVYFPMQAGKRNFVVMMQSPAYNAVNILEQFQSAAHQMKVHILVITSISLVVVIFLVLLFTHNMSMVVHNLSGSMRRAAEGDLTISLNPTADSDFSELATSFNTLIEELRSKERDIEELNQKDNVNDIFKLAVSRLKENNIEEAITLFKTVTILKPDSFGSFFNLGVSYARLGSYESSIDMFSRALDINSGHELAMSYIEKVKNIREKHEGRA